MNSAAAHLHMLVVDDDDVDRERVRRFLSSSPLSVEITEANCGAEALSLIKVHAFDCVVLDNHLGDACGADLIAQLHLEARKDCPIIMLTGAGDEALAVKAIQEGASDYLAKTQLNPEGLVRSVRRSVENHRLRVELATMHQQLEQRVDDQAATIRQRERDLRALIDNSPTVMGYWDREQRCRFGNLTHGDWFFTDAKQLPGRHLREVLGQKLHDAIHLRIDATLAGQTQQFEECIEKRAMTPMRHAQIQFRPDITDDGQVQGFYATMADVTPIKAAQAKAEEFLRFSDAVIENSPIGIAVFTPAGTCMIANAAFIDTCGEPLHVLRGSDFRQRATWQACGLVDEAQRTLSDGSTHRLDVALRKPSGEEVQLACSLASVDRGGQAHLLLIARDITEQRQVLAALVAARDVANSAARAKGAFLANMSHEIRTPMNAIIGLSRLALEDTQPQVARDYVDKVHTSALALMGILDDVLDYSKIEAGYLHFERIRIDLGDLLQRVVDLFQARLEQKRLSLSVELSPRLPKYITADPLRLSQILSNLIGNAIKFTESGHIHVKVEVLDGDAAPAGDLIRFSVSDTGIGIASDLQCLLFDAFVQGDSSITRRFGGTGLGLAICKRLVELMGGHIGVESQPGQGSKFWFTAKLDLGLCLDEPTEDQQVTSPRASSTDKALARSQTLQDMAAPLRGARILLAEDNRLNQIVAEGFLHQLGLEVTVVGDGAQAVSAMQASPPGTFAAILMDLHMPVLDGLESTRRIRALSAGAHTPIIGMTAAVLPEDRAQCLEAGMVDHVSKPVVPERLIQILLRWTQPERASTPPRVNPAPAAPPAASSHDVIDHPLELDLDALRERLHGNEDLLWILLKTFLDSESDTSHVLEGMLSQGEVQRAKFKVHDLKGSSANLGAMRISDASAALETALMKGQGIDSAMAHLRQTLTTGLGTIRFLMSNRSSRGA